MGDVRASRVDAGWPGAGGLVGLPVAAASTVLCVAAYDNRPGLVEVGRGACVGGGGISVCRRRRREACWPVLIFREAGGGVGCLSPAELRLPCSVCLPYRPSTVVGVSLTSLLLL